MNKTEKLILPEQFNFVKEIQDFFHVSWGRGFDMSNHRWLGEVFSLNKNEKLILSEQFNFVKEIQDFFQSDLIAVDSKLRARGKNEVFKVE